MYNLMVIKQPGSLYWVHRMATTSALSKQKQFGGRNGTFSREGTELAEGTCLAKN